VRKAVGRPALWRRDCRRSRPGAKPVQVIRRASSLGQRSRPASSRASPGPRRPAQPPDVPSTTRRSACLMAAARSPHRPGPATPPGPRARPGKHLGALQPSVAGRRRDGKADGREAVQQRFLALSASRAESPGSRDIAETASRCWRAESDGPIRLYSCADHLKVPGPSGVHGWRAGSVIATVVPGDLAPHAVPAGWSAAAAPQFGGGVGQGLHRTSCAGDSAVLRPACTVAPPRRRAQQVGAEPEPGAEPGP